MSVVILADASVNGDWTDPPMTTPPTGPFSRLVPMVNVVTDQLGADGPSLGINSGQSGLSRIDQSVGGTTGSKNVVTSTSGLPPRPMPFERANWQTQPMPFNRLQGRVGYQSAASSLAVRVAIQDATTIPTTAETAAAAIKPAMIDALNLRRGGRFSA